MRNCTFSQVLWMDKSQGHILGHTKITEQGSLGHVTAKVKSLSTSMAI